jgi:hypothetical protein
MKALILVKMADYSKIIIVLEEGDKYTKMKLPIKY